MVLDCVALGQGFVPGWSSDEWNQGLHERTEEAALPHLSSQIRVNSHLGSGFSPVIKMVGIYSCIFHNQIPL